MFHYVQHDKDEQQLLAANMRSTCHVECNETSIFAIVGENSNNGKRQQNLKMTEKWNKDKVDFLGLKMIFICENHIHQRYPRSINLKSLTRSTYFLYIKIN